MKNALALLCLLTMLFVGCTGKDAHADTIENFSAKIDELKESLPEKTNAVKNALKEFGEKSSNLGRETNPFTGKKTLALVNNEKLFTDAFTEYKNFLEENIVLDNTPDGRAVREVGDNLRHAAGEWAASMGQDAYLEDYRWEYHLVENSEANAWCMPGGKIIVYTGILPIAQNKAGLAAVMGHELAHALANHGRQRQSAEILKIGGAIVTAIVADLSGADSQTKDTANTAYDMAATYLGTLPFSRSHESEADEIGLALMTRSGYDPQEAISFWERMSAASSGDAPEFMSTHPSDERRIEAIRKWIETNE